ncbi:MAG TPA: cation:proton antiporter subunit C [Oligoflexia bacterium]|nr:cation:proton antiporter subunit C [Oligoflexia bacterium]HMR24730.1 cation:proton antiporter subunit C [Oligoflexia bacterium]
MTQYFLIFAILCLGLSGVLFCKNLMKKLMALNIMQVSIILFFIAMAYKNRGLAPIGNHIHDISHIINPLPHALMLTAIVVGVATTGLALSLLIRIHGAYGTLDEHELIEKAQKES